VKPAEDFVEVCDVEIEDDTSEEGFGPKIDLDLGTGAEPVRDFGGVGSESLTVFKDYPRDASEKVGEINLDEGPQTPSQPILYISTDDTLTREGTRKRRIKTPSPKKRSETTTSKQASPIPSSEQASTETNPPTSLRTPAFRPSPKRKASSKQGLPTEPEEEPKSKRIKTSSLPLTTSGQISQEERCEG